MDSTFSWDDREFKDQSTKMTDWYKCRLGVRDVIRIIDSAHAVFRHNWEEDGKFRTSMCSMDDHGSCPMCDRLVKVPGHKRQKVYGTIILHLLSGSKEEGAKMRFIGKVKAWRFGDDKKADLVEIHELTKPAGLKGVDLIISVKGNDPQDEKFQKLSIRHGKKFMDSFAQDLRARLTKEVKTRLEEVKKLLHPTPDDLMQFVRAEDEATEFDPEKLNADISEEAVDTSKAPWEESGPESEAAEAIAAEDSVGVEIEEEPKPRPTRGGVPQRKGLPQQKAAKAKSSVFPEEDSVSDELDDFMK